MLVLLILFVVDEIISLFVGFLMEAVYRMKYGELYLFRKVLMETGQTVLANTVPARAVSLVSEDQREIVYSRSF